MPPKTNQQRIKDLEAAVEELRIKYHDLDLDKADNDGAMSIDDRFANHRDIIIKLKDKVDAHLLEPDAHNAAFLAREQREQNKRVAASLAAARKANDED